MLEKYNIGWGLTNKCNMHCEFCYSENARSELEECGIEDWQRFVHTNSECIDSINYGTGENALLDDFFYFAQYVRKNFPDIRQSLTTNGYVGVRAEQNSDFMDIYRNCIDEVDVSIDFDDKERHGQFRGQPNAYEWATNTLRLSREMGKLCTIVFVGFDESCKEKNLDGLFNLAKENDALLRMNIYRPTSKSKKVNDKFILSYDSLKNTLNYINDKYEIVSLSDTLLGNVFTGNTNIKDNTGKSSIRILPDGTICPSTYLISEKYRSNTNISNTVLSKLCFDEFRDVEIPKECAGCEYEHSCRGGVYDRRILWYDTFMERDPYCPLRNKDEIPTEKFIARKIGRVSVHDDYLPTLFFKNRSDEV